MSHLLLFFHAIFSGIAEISQDVVAYLKSDKFAALEKRIAAYLPAAYKVVADIEKLVPNKTTEEVIGAYDKYGVTVVGELTTANVGNQLLNLAGAILKKTFTSASISELNAAIDHALLLVRGVAG
jgi:hypothetical protein